MNKSAFKSVIILLIIVAGGIGFLYAKNQNFFQKPCSTPITYSLGSFDPKFGIPQATFLADVSQAVNIWDAPINKTLFQYSSTGKLKINLVYDARQAATDKLKSLGFSIDDTEASYNALKARYDADTLDYNAQKQSLTAAEAAYEKLRQAYEQAVTYWNNQGGAPRNVVDQLNQQREGLNVQAQSITTEQNQLNSLVDSINALTSELNRIGSELNKDVSAYNTVGQSQGGEFQEGLYTVDSSGQRIDIFEFNDQNQLVRVLAHELGHALGLGHINTNPQAIMYYLNQGKNDKLTADDIAAVKQLCRLQK